MGKAGDRRNHIAFVQGRQCINARAQKMCGALADPSPELTALAHQCDCARHGAPGHLALMRLPSCRNAIMLAGMITYFEQLQQLADSLGVPLEEACAQEGIAGSTLNRWRRGRFECRADTARRLAQRLSTIAGSREDQVNQECVAETLSEYSDSANVE